MEYSISGRGGGGGGGWLWPFLGVQNLEFQYFGLFQKNEYFLGYEDFVDIQCFGVITK